MYHVAWEAGRTREISTPPTCCSETCPRALGNPYNNYQSCASPRAPPASDFLCNYPPEKSMHPPPSPSSSLPLSLFIFILSPNPFFLSFISQTNSIKSTSGCRGIYPKVTFYPSLGLLYSLERTLSRSPTSSKKALITKFSSTFLQTKLFDFLSLDQLSLPKSSPWAQVGNRITDGGSCLSKTLAHGSEWL